MKEDLRQFREQSDKETAEKVINDWVERARKSGIWPLKKMGNTIAAYKSGILNCGMTILCPQAGSKAQTTR